MSTLTLIGSIVTLIGSVFLFLGALGVLRMPDVFNRMQAGTKATTLGSILFLGGIALALPTLWPKLVLLILFLLFTNPVSSHALARASHFIGAKLCAVSVCDNLDEMAEDKGGKN